MGVDLILEKELVVTEVIAFVGPSGTGKSHRAIKTAFSTHSDLIIDDGLLIQGSRIVAGISAKNQATKIAAIKTALFTNPTHRTQAQETIARLKPSRILVLGTSWEMVARITEHLNLPLPEQRLNIEDIASWEDMQKAHYYRNKMGKHVIPAPTVEVKKNFPNTFIDSLKIILDRKDSGRQTIAEQSVIRPTYSSLGYFTIAEKVLMEITHNIVNELPGVSETGRIKISSGQGNAVIDIHYSAKYGYHLNVLSREIQVKVKEALEQQTGLNITAVHILITNLAAPTTSSFTNRLTP